VDAAAAAGFSDSAAAAPAISRCGSVLLEFRYEARRRRLAVVVRSAAGLPSQDRGGSELTEVHLVLLPAKRTRHKTHAKPGANPSFDDNFHFRVPPGRYTMIRHSLTHTTPLELELERQCAQSGWNRCALCECLCVF